MKPITIIIFKYAGILLAFLIIFWWLLFFSPFNIPEFIPYTPIKTYGLLLTISIIFILIPAIKETIKLSPAINLFKLTIVGTAIGFLAEIVFQNILAFTDVEDKLHFILRGVISMTIAFAILSFLISFQLKTKKTGQLLLFILIVLILIKVLIWRFPSIFIHE